MMGRAVDDGNAYQRGIQSLRQKIFWFTGSLVVMITSRFKQGDEAAQIIHSAK